MLTPMVYLTLMDASVDITSVVAHAQIINIR